MDIVDDLMGIGREGFPMVDKIALEDVVVISDLLCCLDFEDRALEVIVTDVDPDCIEMGCL